MWLSINISAFVRVKNISCETRASFVKSRHFLSYPRISWPETFPPSRWRPRRPSPRGANEREETRRWERDEEEKVRGGGQHCYTYDVGKERGRRKYKSRWREKERVWSSSCSRETRFNSVTKIGLLRLLTTRTEILDSHFLLERTTL